MHPNPVFRDDDQSGAILAARQRGFGVLTVNGPDGPMAAHVPFVAQVTELFAHLTRSNPILRALRQGPLHALMIVSGPDGYISPDWYEADDQVPTWNYVAIHLRGQLTSLPADQLYAHLEQVSQQNEAHLIPKKPWTMDKMTRGALDRMMRQIVPVRMSIETVDSTWKLNQNKADDARLKAADQVARSPIGHQTADLADLMRTRRKL